MSTDDDRRQIDVNVGDALTCNNDDAPGCIKIAATNQRRDVNNNEQQQQQHQITNETTKGNINTNRRVDDPKSTPIKCHNNESTQRELNIVIATEPERATSLSEPSGKLSRGTLVAPQRSLGRHSATDDTVATPDSTKQRPYPRQVFYIIVNEFCERFSYYGLRAILVLYFSQVLKFSDSSATITFHLFVMLCYFTPLFGAIMADSYWGKYLTIVYLSLVYLAGELVLVGASLIPSILSNHTEGSSTAIASIFGLVLIGVGTGGIKPCVSALGGDQFDVRHEAIRIARFFSIFYFAINAGSLLSTFLTPILRSDVHCFGRNDCYPLAFSVPCALMLIAIVVFIAARQRYEQAPLPERNAITTFASLVWSAITNRSCGRNNHRERDGKDGEQHKQHWLYTAKGFDETTIEESLSLLSVLTLFVPMPVYWCLFDQQASRWTLQATRMYSSLGIKPDQIQVANPLLLLVMIPTFEWLVYPALRRVNVLSKPLQRMTFGGLLAALAFFVTAIIQAQIDANMPLPHPMPPNISAHLVLVNGLDKCTMTQLDLTHQPQHASHQAGGEQQMTSLLPVLASGDQSIDDSQSPIEYQQLTPLSALVVGNFEPKHKIKLRFDLQDINDNINPKEQGGRTECSIDSGQFEHVLSAEQAPHFADSLVLMRGGDAKIVFVTQANGHVHYVTLPDDLSAPTPHHARIKLIIDTPVHFMSSPSQSQSQSHLSSFDKNKQKYRDSEMLDLFTIRTLHNANGPTQLPYYQEHPSDGNKTTASHLIRHTHYVNVDTQYGNEFALEFPFALTSVPININQPLQHQDSLQHNESWVPLKLETGARYIVVVSESTDQTQIMVSVNQVQDNSYMLNMLWQLIPYAIISASEVMFSVTALEFSYANAPKSMKSVVLAALSLTTTLGNLLTVVIEALSSFKSASSEFTFYGALMVADMAIFALMARNYMPYQSSDNKSIGSTTSSSCTPSSQASNAKLLAPSTPSDKSTIAVVPPVPQPRPRSRPPTTEPAESQ